jgi:hypothetical protein
MEPWCWSLRIQMGSWLLANSNDEKLRPINCNCQTTILQLPTNLCAVPFFFRPFFLHTYKADWSKKEVSARLF